MKKIISLLLSTLVFASVFVSTSVFAEELKTSGDFTYTVQEDGTAELSKYIGESKDVVIPEKIDGYTVTALYDTFLYCEMNSIVIPKTVKTMSENALGFYKDNKLSVDKNNPYFASVDDVIYSKDMTVLVKYAPGKASLSYTVPSSVKKLEASCFGNAKNLQRILLPEGLEEIDDSAFFYCDGLKEIKIPSTVSKIGGAVFSHCISLPSIVIPEGVKYLNFSTFAECDSLKTVVLPESLEYISGDVFFLADGIEEITIPKNVKSIHENTFLSAENLKKVNVDKDNKYFTSYNGDLYSKDMKKLYTHCLGRKEKSVTIPNGVVEIAEDAFWYDENLEEVKIPDSVQVIGMAAFNSCEALKSIKIPDGVKRLEFYTLKCCHSLKTVYLPKTLTYISENFSDEKSLTDVYFDGSKSMWERIKFSGNNDDLAKAKIHFNSKYDTSVTLSKNSGSVYVKGSYQLKPKVYNKYGTTTYKSANTKIAKVNSSGKITGVKAGKTTITVKNNGVSKKFTITVKNPKLNCTKKTIKIGKTLTLKVTGKIGKVKFTSSNKKVATVSNKGVVKAKKAGKVTITVVSNGVKLKCVVTVKKK